ncbi:hypothetical protein ILYODFUR_011178 [Ilyodon furcidens]|uniref:Uncharacterized protein n=1 Tax=Ilyodon furcidens TaxID=33524 RepID=A0ABV0UT73_9TELE
MSWVDSAPRALMWEQPNLRSSAGEPPSSESRNNPAKCSLRERNLLPKQIQQTLWLHHATVHVYAKCQTAVCHKNPVWIRVCAVRNLQTLQVLYTCIILLTLKTKAHAY